MLVCVPIPHHSRRGTNVPGRTTKQQPKKTVVKNQSSSVADRGLSKRTRGRQAHEENIRQHERAAAISEQRALNRPSHQRYVEVLRTGHNVISNRVFTGREGKPPPQPRAKPSVPVWARLSRQPGQPGQPEPAAAVPGPTRGQERSQREEAGSTAPATAPGGSGRDLRDDRGGSGESSRRRGRGEDDSGDRGSEKGGKDRQPPLEEGNCADAGRSTKAAHEDSHTKPTVPPLDLSLQPS